MSILDQYPWYLRIFGFRKLYQVKVMSEPKLKENGDWSYECKLLSYEIRWFGLKLKTIIYDTL